MRQWGLCVLLLILSGCAGGPAERREYAALLAGEGGLHPVSFDAGTFVLIGQMRGQGPVLTAYVEGDGAAWVTRHQLSDDPTPRDPVALELAVRDPGPAVLYLGRPCQYVAPHQKRNCDARYWSSHRFAPEVIEATSTALDQAKRQAGAQRVVLVGYSGGGPLAALVAARRTDVAALITVAAPLDTDAWTDHHRVSPLTGSLNPVNEAARLQGVRQHHFVGSDDEIVPPQVQSRFLARFLARVGNRGTQTVISGADHHCCWARLWPDLRRRVPEGL